MRIAIDYSAAISFRGEGIGRYTAQVVDALLQQETSDTFTLFSNTPPRGGQRMPSGPNVRRRLLPIGMRAMTRLWHQWRVPLVAEAVMGRADVVHEPNFGLPPTWRARRVATIHDLVLLTHPQYFPQRYAAEWTRMLLRAAREADHLIAVSERTRDDLVSVLGVDPARISVSYLGVDAVFQPVSDAARRAALDARLGLAHPLVLCVGTVQPRKNYERLIQAFARATARPDGPRMLAIAGKRGWDAEGITAAIAHSGVAERVRFLEYIPEADLPTLYSTADAFALVSLYEGFGLPLLEAMACGTPALASDAGSLPEVAGDAALVVAPEDVVGMAEALTRLVSDAALRDELRARGLARAQRFTWERAAREHLAVYRALGQR